MTTLTTDTVNKIRTLDALVDDLLATPSPSLAELSATLTEAVDGRSRRDVGAFSRALLLSADDELVEFSAGEDQGRGLNDGACRSPWEYRPERADWTAHAEIMRANGDTYRVEWNESRWGGERADVRRVTVTRYTPATAYVEAVPTTYTDADTDVAVTLPAPAAELARRAGGSVFECVALWSVPGEDDVDAETQVSVGVNDTRIDRLYRYGSRDSVSVPVVPPTTAQAIAARLAGDGQKFADDHGHRLAEISIEAGGGVDWRDGFQTGDTYRHAFADGSAIVVAGDAWDVRAAGCAAYCWDGVGCSCGAIADD